MTSKPLSGLMEFDAAKYLKTPEDCQLYVAEAMKTGDAAFIARSLGVVAKANGMTDLAKKTGLSRETLYRSLSENGNPNLKTLLAVTNALGLSLTISSPSKQAVAATS